MNKLEHRLNAAAEETRHLARQRPLTRFAGRPEPRHRGMLVLASAFAVVIVLFGLLPFLMSEPTQPRGADSAPSTSVDTPTTVATTIGTAPEEGCSAEGVALPGPAEGLPAPVAETRDAIIAAAAACDIPALESLASETFNTSFGGGGAEKLREWEDRGEGRLGTLLHLLDMTYGTNRSGDSEIYIWPAAAIYESWDEIPDAELDELSRIYSEDELDQIAGFGSYAGWRTAIDQDGNWLYFVAGD